MGWISAAINAVAGHATAWQNAYHNKKSAKQAFERTMLMSNTAHQREVADLEAAGLNPVLSALGNGASSVAVPVGGSNPHQGVAPANIAQGELAREQRKKVAAEQNVLNTQSEKNQAEANYVAAQRDGVVAENVLKVAKSDWFKGLDTTQKYEVINAMMFPNNTVGQARGIVSTLFDTGSESENGGRSSAKSLKESPFFTDYYQTSAGKRYLREAAKEIHEANRRDREERKRNPWPKPTGEFRRGSDGKMRYYEL